jgi:hypothetical protein
MIQRIQSLYLLIASGAFSSLFALPFLTTTSNNSATTVPQMADGSLNLFDNIGLLGLTVLTTAIALAAIFLYKNRNLQGKIAGLGILTGVMVLILAAIATQGVRSAIPSDGTVQFGLGWGAPVVGAVLLWLASRAIQKDERLVRSMDRLR